jgi:hypothetical protein
VITASSRPTHSENRIDTEAVDERADALDCLVTAFGDDIGRAELLRQGDAIRSPAQEDDPSRAEPLGRDHAAQSDSPIPDHCHCLPRTYESPDGGVMAGSHHIRQREQRRHQRIVLLHGQDNEGSVGLWNTHRLSLAAIDIAPAVPAAVETGAV